jgi:hypothetical protein
MRDHYDLETMKSWPNPYAARLKEATVILVVRDKGRSTRIQIEKKETEPGRIEEPPVS